MLHRNSRTGRPRARDIPKPQGFEQVAFLMHLKPGKEAEYRTRHDQIWPELKAALEQAGICDYSIFLDEQTGNLFAVLRQRPGNTIASLPAEPVMRRWWDHMADLMEVEGTNRPIQRSLVRMFHMD